VPKLHFEIPHQLSAEESQSRLARFTEFVEAKYKDQVSDLTQSWAGNRLDFGFKTYGIKIQGSITAEENNLVVDGDLPFSAMLFKGKIETDMRQQLERIVG
jgi:hypothetical protein